MKTILTIYTPTNKSDKKEESKIGKSIINITKKYIENSIKNMESWKIEDEPDFNQSWFIQTLRHYIIPLYINIQKLTI